MTYIFGAVVRLIASQCPVIHAAEVYMGRLYSQQTRGILQMLFQCWASVKDSGLTLKQHWVNVSCLLVGRTRPLKNIAQSPPF